jgi:hypothetical protein
VRRCWPPDSVDTAARRRSGEVDGVDRGGDGGAVLGAHPARPALARQPAGRHDLLDRRRDGAADRVPLRHVPIR